MEELNRKVSLNLSSRTLFDNNIYLIHRLKKKKKSSKKTKDNFFVKRIVKSSRPVKVLSLRNLKFPLRLHLIKLVKTLFSLLNVNPLLFSVILMKLKNVSLYKKNTKSKRVFISFDRCSSFTMK